MYGKNSTEMETVERIFRHLKVIYRELIDCESLAVRENKRLRFMPCTGLVNDIQFQKSALRMLAFFSLLKR